MTTKNLKSMGLKRFNDKMIKYFDNQALSLHKSGYAICRSVINDTSRTFYFVKGRRRATLILDEVNFYVWLTINGVTKDKKFF